MENEQNLSLVATQVQRWACNQIKHVDNDVENHIISVREANGIFLVISLSTLRVADLQ